MIVQINWVDAAGGDGWVDKHQIERSKLAEIETIGFLVSEDKTSVTLTMAKDVTNENYGAYMHIPKSCITKRKKIAS